jgi:hypothetical protein
MMHPNIRHVFFDHDLTLTCHQGLISIDQMNKVCATFPLTVSKHFDQWVSYFFGSTRRYQALHQLLDNLNAKGIKTYIITKQPDTLTIEHFMRLCKLHTFFPHSRCISSTLVGKEKLAIINEVTGSSSHVSRSPRHQSKGTTASDPSVGDAPRKKSGKRPDTGSTNASPPPPSPPTLSSGRSQASRNVASQSSIARPQSPASAIATFPPPTTTTFSEATATTTACSTGSLPQR